MFDRLRRSRGPLAGAILACLCLAGCGSSSTSTSSTPNTPAPAPTHILGQLRGESHAPTVNRDWRYSVRVTNATGRPLSGTVAIEFVFGGQVVGRDTPPVHTVRDGLWQDRIQFPEQAVGMALTFRAVVHTGQGSLTVDWPVKVRR